MKVALDSLSSLYESNISTLKKISNGKVRDIYEIDDNHILIITTDRISAFDVILSPAIPGKGCILTSLSNFWFAKTRHIIPNHLTELDLSTILPIEEFQTIKDRAIVAKKLKPLPVEAIVRGYLVGSGWNDYKKTNSVCGIPLPAELQLASQLPEPIFTPSTKADIGDHDENINFEKMKRLIGTDLAEQVRNASLDLYTYARDYALERGIIIADTKFEFGLDKDNQLVLIDEILTPDSSRFWPANQYQPGTNPPSFDKQFVRDYLNGLDWNKKAPSPELPQNIISKTAEKYQEALAILTK